MPHGTSEPDRAWAGLAAAGHALLVPLTPEIRRAGAELAERARERQQLSGSDAGDILAGNAHLALKADTGDARGMAAACLGAIAELRGVDTFVVRVTREGSALDCAIESVEPGDAPAHAVRQRLATVANLQPDALVPGRAVTADR